MLAVGSSERHLWKSKVIRINCDVFQKTIRSWMIASDEWFESLQLRVVRGDADNIIVELSRRRMPSFDLTFHSLRNIFSLDSSKYLLHIESSYLAAPNVNISCFSSRRRRWKWYSTKGTSRFDQKHSSEVDCEVGTASFIKHDEEGARYSQESIGFETREPEEQPSFLQREVTISVALILIIVTLSLIVIIPLLELAVQREGSSKPAIANESSITSVPGCGDPALEDIDGLFDPRALQELCTGVKWQDGLVFSVWQSIAGGVPRLLCRPPTHRTRHERSFQHFRSSS